MPMRSSVVSSFVAIASAVSVACAFACGGGTPPAKTGDDVASKDPAKDTTASSASSDAPAPAASDAPSKPSSAPDAGAASSGDMPTQNDDPWMAHHQMPPGDVLKTVRPAQSKVQACFRAGQKRDPSVSGEVKVRFIITNDGVVRDWKDDSSSMSDEEVTKCVGGVVKTLKFPKQKSPGDAYGVYSINFTP